MLQRVGNSTDKTLKDLKAATLVKFLGVIFWEISERNFQSNFWGFLYYEPPTTNKEVQWLVDLWVSQHYIF